jgi:hypothetical protein
MSVVEQLEEFLRANPTIASDPLAAAASALAGEIDDPPIAKTGAVSIAASAVAFQKLMVELRRMLPEESSEVSKVDELQQRRKKKMGAAGA